MSITISLIHVDIILSIAFYIILSSNQIDSSISIFNAFSEFQIDMTISMAFPPYYSLYRHSSIWSRHHYLPRFSLLKSILLFTLNFPDLKSTRYYHRSSSHWMHSSISAIFPLNEVETVTSAVFTLMHKNITKLFDSFPLKEDCVAISTAFAFPQVHIISRYPPYFLSF